jgi:hypothetical protein
VGTVEHRGAHYRISCAFDTYSRGGGDTSHSLGVLLRLPLGHV